MLVRHALLLTLLILAAATPRAAAATTFGADLGRTPNATFTCAVIPAGGWLMPGGGSSCTHFTTSAALFSSAESNLAPAGFGVITKIRVRTGPTVGRMQVVTLRSIKQSTSTGDAGCCWPQYASPIFTPNPNTITEIPTSLPVINVGLLAAYLPIPGSTLPTGPNTDPYGGIHEASTGIGTVENYDGIALSILDPGTPIPAAYDAGTEVGGMVVPAITARTQLSLSGSWNGYFGTATRGMHLLLQATWEPDIDHDGLGDETQDPNVTPTTPAAPTPAAPAADTTPPTVTLKVKNRNLTRALTKGLEVRISCNEPCQATSTITRGHATVGGGTLRFSAAGQQTQYLTIGKRTRKALRRATRAKLTITTTAKDAAGNTAHTTVPATLRR